MKSKNPPRRHSARGLQALAGASAESGRAITLDFVQHRIETFNQAQGGGVLVKKDRNGYTLLREDTFVPIARLRPKDSKGHFEVLYWNASTERWRAVGLLGGTVLPLDEALEFIASNPMDCFWI